jgi:hypothetical protein
MGRRALITGTYSIKKTSELNGIAPANMDGPNADIKNQTPKDKSRKPLISNIDKKLSSSHAGLNNQFISIRWNLYIIIVFHRRDHVEFFVPKMVHIRGVVSISQYT